MTQQQTNPQNNVEIAGLCRQRGSPVDPTGGGTSRKEGKALLIQWNPSFRSLGKALEWEGGCFFLPPRWGFVWYSYFVGRGSAALHRLSIFRRPYGTLAQWRNPSGVTGG